MNREHNQQKERQDDRSVFDVCCPSALRKREARSSSTSSHLFIASPFAMPSAFAMSSGVGGTRPVVAWPSAGGGGYAAAASGPSMVTNGSPLLLVFAAGLEAVALSVGLSACVVAGSGRASPWPVASSCTRRRAASEALLSSDSSGCKVLLTGLRCLNFFFAYVCLCGNKG